MLIDVDFSCSIRAFDSVVEDKNDMPVHFCNRIKYIYIHTQVDCLNIQIHIHEIGVLASCTTPEPSNLE